MNTAQNAPDYAAIGRAVADYLNSFASDEDVSGADFIEEVTRIVNDHGAYAPAEEAGVETEKILVVSTAHITEKDGTLLENGPDGHNYPPYFKREEGFLMSTGLRFPYADGRRTSDDRAIESGLSEALVNVLREARKRGLQWVMFDRDGPELDGFPTFDW